MMKKSVIFDLDGTLINTQKDLALICNSLFEKEGIEAQPIQKFQNYVGWGIRVFIEKAWLGGTGRAIDSQLLDKIYHDFIAIYNANPVIYTQKYPGIDEMLAQLKGRDYFLAVLTNKKDLIAKKVVDIFFPTGIFDAVMGPNKENPKKPDPTCFNRLLDLSGSNLNSVFYCGDSLIDLKTAKNGKVAFIGVSWGFEKAQRLQEENADFIITHPSEILTIIDHHK